MWHFELNSNFVTMYFNTTDQKYIKMPAGKFIILSNVDGVSISIRTAENTVLIPTVNTLTGIAYPARGVNSYMTYMEKLGQYLNGDSAIVF